MYKEKHTGFTPLNAALRQFRQKRNYLTGFTLIELLVVLAIFGLLVSVVVVSISGTRKKGSEAAGRLFSATIQHSLGADAVGMWGFDEGSGITAKDNSGNGFNGTLFNGPTWTNSGIIRNALEFDGDNDYVKVSNPPAGSMPNEAMTIESWAYFDSFTGWRMIESKYTSFYFGIHYGNVWFYWSAGGAYGTYLVAAKAITETGIWYHIAATFGPEGSVKKMRIYLNGKEVIASGNLTGNIISNTYPLFIGTFGDTAPYCCYFDGKIDEVRTYKRNLTAFEIQKHYVEGAKKRGIAEND